MRIAVIIDGPNLYGMIKLLDNKRVDWTVFLKHIKWLGKRQDGHQTEITVQKVFYDHRPFEKKANGFLDYMAALDFKLIGAPLKVYAPNPNNKVFKSRTDQKLAVTTMEHLLNDDFDTLVLVAGDSDYEFLIDACQKRGKRVWVWATFHTLSCDLKQTAGRYYLFDDPKNSHLLTVAKAAINF